MATYNDLALIQSNQDFVQRCTGAIQKFAVYILGQTPTVPGGQIVGKLIWARNAALNPSVVFQQYQNLFIQDATFTGLADGTKVTDAAYLAITDAQFDTVVQTALETTMQAW
jgi:hypothetical protein